MQDVTEASMREADRKITRRGFAMTFGILAAASYILYSAQTPERNYRQVYETATRLADRNSDGTLSRSERIDLWVRMGYDRDHLTSLKINQFPRPKLKDLYRGIESYERTDKRTKKDIDML